MAAMHPATSAKVQNVGIWRTYAFPTRRANYVCSENTSNLTKFAHQIRMGVSHLAVICTMWKGLLGLAIVSVAFPILICSLIAALSCYVLLFCGCFSFGVYLFFVQLLLVPSRLLFAHLIQKLRLDTYSWVFVVISSDNIIIAIFAIIWSFPSLLDN